MRRFGQPAEKQYYEDEISRQCNEARELESRKPGNSDLIIGYQTSTFFVSSPEGNRVFGVRDGQEYDSRLFSVLYNGNSPTGWKLRQNQKRAKTIEGVELVLSMPKTLSMYWALGMAEANKKVTKYVVGLQCSATRAAFRFFSKDILHTRKGKSGATSLIGGVTGGVVFTHFDSRPIGDEAFGDPHIHTHFVLFNSVFREGKCRVIDGKSFFNRKSILLINQAYHNALADGLRRENVPFDECIGADGTVSVRLKGISIRQEALFKKRSDQIQESIQSMPDATGRRTVSVPGEAQRRTYAALSTRRDKKSNIVGQLLSWRDQFRSQGLSISGLTSVWEVFRSNKIHDDKYEESVFTSGVASYLRAHTSAERPARQVNSDAAWKLDARLYALRLGFGLTNCSLERINKYFDEAINQLRVREAVSQSISHGTAGHEREISGQTSREWIGARLRELRLRPALTIRKKIASLRKRIEAKASESICISLLKYSGVNWIQPSGNLRISSVAESPQALSKSDVTKPCGPDSVHLNNRNTFAKNMNVKPASELGLEEHPIRRIPI